MENFLIPSPLVSKLERGVRFGFKRMGRSLNMITRQMGLILLVISLLMGICDGAEEDIYKIVILGNVKIEEGAIRGAIKSQEGGSFSVQKLSEDLRSIFDLGYFTDVQGDHNT